MSEKKASPVTSRDRKAPCRSKAAKAAGEVVRQKYVSRPSRWMPTNGYRNENALVTFRGGRSVWMRRISVRAAVRADSQTSHVMRVAAFTRVRRLRSRFLRPVVRY